MKRTHLHETLASRLTSTLLLLFSVPGIAEQPTPSANAAFDNYTREVEARLTRGSNALAGPALLPAEKIEALQRGALLIDPVPQPFATSVPGAMLHVWRGTAFVPFATVAGFQSLMQDIRAYPRIFAPQVLAARVTSRQGDNFEATLRIVQRHVLTVVIDTRYNIRYRQLDAQHGYSLSRSNRVEEIAATGTSHEHALTPGEDHGFLWRQNTYWTYAERDGGLYLQVESVSLTRSVPPGLGWAIRPLLDSVPRDSLLFTLQAVKQVLVAPSSGVHHTPVLSSAILERK